MAKKKPRKLTVQQAKMIKALEASYSNVTEAVKEVGICRATHYGWIDKNIHYKKEVEDLNEGLLDRAENILMGRLSESDTALIFYLKTRGKKRGYVERTEQEIKGEVNVKGYSEFFTT